MFGLKNKKKQFSLSDYKNIGFWRKAECGILACARGHENIIALSISFQEQTQ